MSTAKTDNARSDLLQPLFRLLIRQKIECLRELSFTEVS